MPKPHFLFCAHRDSYSVKVQNLESLSVAQIVEIEAFVKSRKGIFDFNTYTFAIQKRVSFEEFAHLLGTLHYDVFLQELKEESKTLPRVAFGEYKGMFFSELPQGYLLWLEANYFGTQKALISEELKKRPLQ